MKNILYFIWCTYFGVPIGVDFFLNLQIIFANYDHPMVNFAFDFCNSWLSLTNINVTLYVKWIKKPKKNTEIYIKTVFFFKNLLDVLTVCTNCLLYSVKIFLLTICVNLSSHVFKFCPYQKKHFYKKFLQNLVSAEFNS